MIDQLCLYHRRTQTASDPKERLSPFRLERKEIPFIIVLDEQGKLINLSDTRVKNGDRKTSRVCVLPHAVVGRTSKIIPNLLWDTPEYVLGVQDKTKPSKAPKHAQKHESFKKRLLEFPAQEDAGIRAVIKFLGSLDLSQLEAMPGWSDLTKGNLNLTFQLQGDLGIVSERSEVLAAIRAEVLGVSDGVDIITGKPVRVARLHHKIKGDHGGKEEGASLVSFNEPSSEHFGKKQGLNAPMGEQTVFEYSTALNHLLRDDSKQRIKVGEASIVWWASAPSELESLLQPVFGGLPKKGGSDPNVGVSALETLYRSAQTGKFALDDKGNQFHVLGLKGNAGRLSIRFFKTGTSSEIAQNVINHFEDLKMVTERESDSEYISLYRLLAFLTHEDPVSKKRDIGNLPPNLGESLMQAILEDQPYPDMILRLALIRCCVEKWPGYIRAAVIKASLNRKIRRSNRNTRNLPKKEFLAMLDSTNTNPGYLLGRLFSTLEQLQSSAHGKQLNTTIRDRFYGMASRDPRVLKTLLTNSIPHISKLKGRAPKLAGFYEKKIGEIMGGLGVGNPFPNTFTSMDQGGFHLGYWHQRAFFFTKKVTPEVDGEPTEEVADGLVPTEEN